MGQMGPKIPGREDDEPGTFRLYCLSESGSLGGMDFRLIPAPDEAQAEALTQLHGEMGDAARAALRDALPAPVKAPVKATDSDDIVVHHILPEYPEWQALANAIMPALCTALGVWLGSRNGRSVSIKIGDIEVKAQTKEEVEKLFSRALEIQQETQQRNQPPKIIP